jgi:ribosomal protein S21
MDENKKQKKKFVKEEVYLYGHANGVKVINGNVEAAIRKWKRIMKDSGIMEEIRNRKEYKKPTTVRREKRNAALRAEWVRRRREE